MALACQPLLGMARRHATPNFLHAPMPTTTARKSRQDECPGSLSFIVLRTATVEREERIAASRMIYYLVVAALLFVTEQF